MNSIYEELLQILSCELDLHNKLVEIASAFNKSIREDNLNEIQNYTAKYDELICQIEKLEEKRNELCCILRKKIGLQQKEPRLLLLIESAPLNLKNSLSNVHQKLKEKIETLSKITVSNRILLENALTVINSTISIYQQSQKKFEPYGIRKKGKAFQNYSLINRTI